MNHRFPIGTQYITKAKAGRKIIETLHTVVDQMTVTNSRGEVVRCFYVSEHDFCGQKVINYDVVDTTIALNIVNK